jgi:hypothetical protein
MKRVLHIAVFWMVEGIFGLHSAQAAHKKEFLMNGVKVFVRKDYMGKRIDDCIVSPQNLHSISAKNP